MTTQIVSNGHAPATLLEKVLIAGDLEALNPEQRLDYYQRVCESLGFNPLTRPFDYIKLNSKLTLYAKRDATDQLRKINNVSVTIVGREKLDDVYVVTARATMPDGRTDESIGAVPIANLRGEALANGLMKAETKAKRRVTLSLCGLGFLDETEIESIPDAQRVTVSPSGEVVNMRTGELLAPVAESPSEAHADRAMAAFWALAKNELGYPSKKAVHVALGLPPTDGALATYVRDALGGDWRKAIDHLKTVGRYSAPAGQDDQFPGELAIAGVMTRLRLDESTFKQRMKIDPRESLRDWGTRIGWDKAQAEAEGYESFLKENPGAEGDAAVFE